MLQIKLSILSYLPINVLLLREKLTDSLPSYLGVQNLTTTGLYGTFLPILLKTENAWIYGNTRALLLDSYIYCN